MEATENPYLPPREENVRRIVSPDFDLRPILQRWEKLRTFYNLTLIAVTFLVTIAFKPFSFGFVDYWILLVVGAVVANVCFFLGPATDAYLQWFRIWHIGFTWLVFIVGLGLASALAALSIIGSWQFPW